MTRTRAYALTAAAAILALTAACGGDDGAEPTQTEAAPTTATATTSDPTPSETAPVVLDFGTTHTYGDGFALTADLGDTFVPTEYGDTEDYVLIEWTFTNDTDTALQFDSVFQGCTVDGVTSAEGYELFDGITTQWPNLISGGSDATWTSACLVGDGTELQIDMQVGDYPVTYWTGTVPQ